jgi:hypothetical protein
VIAGDPVSGSPISADPLVGGSGPSGYTLTAAAGSFALSGQNANLLYGRRLAAGAGSFAETGQPASLLKGSRVAVGTGSFALSGQSANLLKGSRVAAGAGTFVLSGQAVALKFGRALAAGAGSFALAGQAAALLALRRLSTGAGAFVLSGLSVGLLVASGPAVLSAGGVFRRLGDLARVFRRAGDLARVFRGWLRMGAEIQYDTRPKDASETILFVFDFSRFPEVVGGETLSNPTVDAVAGLTIGAPAVTTTDQVVFSNGQKVAAGKGVQVAISGGTAGQTYALECHAATSGGANRDVKGSLVVE